MTRAERPPQSAAGLERSLPLIAAVACITAGAIALLGHATGLSWLESLIPSFPIVPIDLAVALVPAGASLAGRAQWDGALARFAVPCALLTVAVGIVLALDHPITGIAVVLAGLALISAEEAPRRARAPFSPLVALLGGFVLLALAAFVAHPADLDAVSQLTGTGIQVWTAMAVLCLGIAALEPDRGPAAALFGGRRPRSFLIWSVVLVPLVGIAAVAVAIVGGTTAVVVRIKERITESESERRRAIQEMSRHEQHLLAMQKRYSALLEAAPDAIVIVNPSGTIAVANDQAERLFGYARGTLVGMPVEQLVPEGLRSRHEGHRSTFLQSPHARPMGAGLDLMARRADGSELPVEISLAVAETDGDGTLVTAAVRDVTERREAAAALRAAEQRFRSAFEDAPIGMAILDLDGSFVQVNRALCEITGYPREQLEATRLDSITQLDDTAAVRERLEQMLLDSAHNYSAEMRFMHAEGQPVSIELTATLILDAEEHPSHFLAQIQDITERKRFEGQLQYLADHDALTGLFNRRRFDDEMRRALAHSRRQGAACCVLALDLDNFKYLNDSLGHPAGDELITRVSQQLRAEIRETDVLARLGGDEFGVVLPYTDVETARQMAKRLLDAVRSGAEVQVGRHSHRLTASVGIASLSPTDELTADEIMIEADVAMYDAKEAGRDRVSVYTRSPDRERSMEARLTWVQRIRSAIENDQFVLHAQPILGLSGDTRPRHELLLRMQGEDGDVIPPASFLSIAERFELVKPIDRWVVRNGIALLAEQQRADRDLVLEINLSAKSVTDLELPAYIEGELERTGADPRGLCFEITETAAIVNLDRAKVFAERLASIGCEFALDDFGAGFASFYYLKHLAFDYLKIDGEFVRDLGKSRTNQLVVRSVVEIAKGLGKRTIAEFVEDEKTLEMLRNYGVDYAQGFHIAKPAAVEAAGLAGPRSEPVGRRYQAPA